MDPTEEIFEAIKNLVKSALEGVINSEEFKTFLKIIIIGIIITGIIFLVKFLFNKIRKKFFKKKRKIRID